MSSGSKLSKRTKKDYPIPFIYTLLEHYDSLYDGVWFESEGGEKVKAKSNRAPFEAAIIAKTDIDMALDSLSPEEQLVINRLYFEERELDPDSMRIVKRAVFNMGNYLNGECILNRWARENKLVDSTKNVRIPEDLSRDIDQYIKDICIRKTQ